MIRAAKFADVPRLYELMVELYERSIYAGVAGYEPRDVKALLVNSIQRHGGKNAGARLVLVDETNGVVEGFIVGMLDPIYHLLDRLLATDIFYFCSPRAEPSAALRLLKGFVKWAKSCPKVAEIRLGAMSVGGTPHEHTAKLYERVGMEQCGVIYSMHVGGS